MIIRFGSCEVDLDRMEIRRNSQSVAVEPQVFDVLAYLIEHRDRLVTKEELLDNVWGDRFVSESALTSRIKSARQAVGDDGRTQGVIRTVHGRGYRFVATVEVDGATDGDPPGPAMRPATQEERPGVWPLVGRHDELEQLVDSLHDRSRSGTVITGPAGVGKSRLAAECARLAERSGSVVARVHGSADTRTVPLACMAHLLPTDVIAEVAQSGDMARAVLFIRARAALEQFASDDRLVLVVENADQLDELSAALVSSLAGSDSIYVLLTQRTGPGDPVVLSELIGSNQIARIDLAPLDDTDLDVLLYRVLEGPIDIESLEQLITMSRGSPGALGQLVDAALASGSLAPESGVWRLVRPLRPTVDVGGGEQVDVADLEPDALAAAELLAVAGDLEIGLASSIVGEPALDLLDDAGLLAVSDGDGQLRVSLAHRHVQILLAEGLGPLRSRRYKAQLAQRMISADLTTKDRFRMVRWSIETGTTPPRGELIEAARSAVATADPGAADLILDHIDQHAPGADARMLRAEMTFRRGQTDVAEQLLESIAAQDLDPDAAALTARRRATILFHVRSRFDEALGLLADDELAPTAHPVVAAHRVILEANYGRVDEAIRIADGIGAAIGGIDRHLRLEVLRGLGHAHLLRGEITAAQRHLDEHQRLLVARSTTAERGWSENAISVMVTAAAVLGDLGRAGELVREHLPYGRRTHHAMLPIAAARVELAAGRARSARSAINSPLAAVRSQNLRHAEPLMGALLAQTHLALDDRATARHLADQAAEWLDELAGQPLFALARELSAVWIRMGDTARARSQTLDVAESARAFGARLSEAELLASAAVAGAAADVADRVDELAEHIDGQLWSLRARHVRALADGSPIEQIAADYRELGEVGLAELSARPLG